MKIVVNENGEIIADDVNLTVGEFYVCRVNKWWWPAKKTHFGVCKLTKIQKIDEGSPFEYYNLFFKHDKNQFIMTTRNHSPQEIYSVEFKQHREKDKNFYGNTRAWYDANAGIYYFAPGFIPGSHIFTGRK